MNSVAAGIVLLTTLVPRAGGAIPAPGQTGPSDSASVAAVVAAFHAALRAGDSIAALALLAPDVVILESGGSETLEEYRAAHLPADIEFARATTGDGASTTVVVRDGVAWAWAVSRTRGEFRGRPIDADAAELMVLVRDGDGWRIAAIHWSSRRRPT